MNCIRLLMLAAATGLSTIACTDTTIDPIVLDRGDPIVYATEVQSYVGLGCGSLDCHGDGGRALRLYAKFGLRESDELRTLDVADSEVAANLDAFAAIAAGGEVADDLAVLKPLAESAGGMAHEGGDVFAARDSPGYLCLSAFLSGASDGTACIAALAEVDIGP